MVAYISNFDNCSTFNHGAYMRPLVHRWTPLIAASRCNFARYSTARRISTEEYRVRVGKTCRVLSETLPDFMSRGAVDLDDLETPVKQQHWLTTTLWGKDAKQSYDEHTSLYHPAISFEFKPPIADHGPSISFHGRTVYLASSHVLRHALSALFYDTKLHVESARQEPDRFIVRIRFEGVSRVTLQPHTYTVIFRYEFEREAGTISRHHVDSIQPVPGSKVWAGLASAWPTT